MSVCIRDTCICDCLFAFVDNLCVHVCVCVWVFGFVCACVYVCMFASVCVFIYTWKYATVGG